MNDIIAVLGAGKVMIIGGLMVGGLAVTLLACIPTAYVTRVVRFLRRIS